MRPKRIEFVVIKGEEHVRSNVDLGTKNDARAIGQHVLNLCKEESHVIFIYPRKK